MQGREGEGENEDEEERGTLICTGKERQITNKDTTRSLLSLLSLRLVLFFF